MRGYTTRRQAVIERSYDHEILALVSLHPEGLGFDDILDRMVGGGSQYVERALERLTRNGHLTTCGDCWVRAQ